MYTIKRIFGPLKNRIDRCIASIFSVLPIRSNRICLVGDGNFRDNTRVFFDFLIHYDLNKKFQIIILVDDVSKYKYLATENVKVIRRNAPYPLVIKNFYLATSKTILYTHGISIKNRRPNQLVIHTTHSASQLKAIPKDAVSKNGELFKKDYHLRCGHEGQRILINAWGIDQEKLPILGMPRLDLLFRHRDVMGVLFPGAKVNKCILAMETFRQAPREGYTDSNNLSVYGLNVIKNIDELESLSRYLEDNGFFLLIKPHPKQDLSIMQAIKTHNIHFITDDELEMNGIQLYELVENCHVLLTDYSSIFYDYLLLDRPIGFLVNDIDDYQRGFIYDDPLLEMPGEKIRTFRNLIDFIEKVKVGEDVWQEERNRILKEVFMYRDNNNCRRLLSFIENYRAKDKNTEGAQNDNWIHNRSI